MLKLKKVSRHQDLYISLGTRESIFNKTFLYAFSIAFLLHFTALIFFHISPFKLRHSQQTHPFIFVESDLPISKEQVSAQLNQEHKMFYSFLFPKPSSPGLPKITEPMLIRKMEVFKKHQTLLTHFSKLEREYILSHFLKEKAAEAYSPIQVHISGKLAEKKLQHLSLPTSKSYQGPLRRFQAIYKVQVEGKSGQVFFFESKETALSNNQKQIAEKILKELKFQKDLAALVIPGEIELIFTEEGI